MSKKAQGKKSQAKVIEFVLDEVAPISSGETPPVSRSVESEPVSLVAPTDVELEGRSPAFKELALPKLPTLEKQNRARLQVQSPNRIFFYWSLKENPYRVMGRTVSDATEGYTLILRLIDTESEREELNPIEPDGTWWFNAEAGRSYRAEIGLYSPSRPFIRVLFSNTVTTPRKSPSTRAATDAEWRVGAYKFAEVLDASGFQRDAFDVAIAGDDPQIAEDVAFTAFRQFLDSENEPLDGISADEIRFVMLAIASGRAIEELKFKIGAALYAILQAHADRLAAERSSSVLNEYFDIEEYEFEEEEFGPAVFGASRVNFPKSFRTRNRDYSPISSHSNR